MVLNDVKEGGSGGSVAAELRPLPSSSLEYVYTNEDGQPQTIQRCDTFIRINLPALRF